MAYVAGKSGSFDFTDGYFTIQVNWSEDYDVSANTSIVQIDSIKVKARAMLGTWYMNGIAKINGETVCTMNYYSPSTHKVTLSNADTWYSLTEQNSGKAFPWKSSPIAHDSEGNKTVTISIVNNPAGNNISSIQLYRTSDASIRTFGATQSTNVLLTHIARASQPSLVTWPETTQNVGDFGEEFSIHMNAASQDFRHTVRYEYGDRSGTIATNVVNGTTWTVPLSFMNDIPNATSASGLIYVDTYSNGTKIGTKYTGFTVSVPASVKPSCSVTLDDTTGNDTIYGSPIQGLSKIKVTATPTLAYSSPIASYSISIDGVKYSSQTATTGFLTKGGDSVVTVTVKDKRGRTSEPWEYTMKVQEYNKPSISYLSVHRCDADGNEDDQGDFVSVNFSASIYPLKNLNTAKYVLKYKKTSETSWTSVNLPLANVYTAEDESHVFEADAESSYDVQLEATDKHNSTSRATSVSTAFTLIDYHNSGTGIRFGGIADAHKTFRNDLKFRQTENSYCFYSEGTPGVKGYVAIAKIEITHMNANAPITFCLTRRNANAPMTVHVRFENISATNPGLDRIIYEGENYGAFLWQESESVWILYVEKTSQNDPITLQRWTTSMFMDGRILVSFPGGQVETLPTPFYRATPAESRGILDYVYPVGSIYLSYSHVSPADLFGGTWVRIENAFLWATTPGGTIGQTGGESTHTLTVNEMPSHKHDIAWNDANPQIVSLSSNKATASTSTAAQQGYRTSYSVSNVHKDSYIAMPSGGGAAHNNMPPYIQISAWRRTA